jgi:membrane-associated phospholipid phosphatase
MARNPRYALCGALACGILLYLTWLLAFHVGFVGHLDRATLTGFLDLKRPHVESLASRIARLADPAPYTLMSAALVVLAVVRRRPRVALASAVVLVCAPFTSELLKPLLAAPRDPAIDSPFPLPASWPSGHATAAMTLALVLVMVVPARWRPRAAALGAAFAIAVTYSFLTLGWHYPSDAVGGFLMAGLWVLLAIAAIWAADARWPRRTGRAAALRVGEALGPPLTAVVVAGILGLWVLLARPLSVLSYARDHTAFMVGAGGLAVLGLALATGLALALRRFG